MFTARTILSAIALVASALSGVSAETHVVTFDNRCGSGTVRTIAVDCPSNLLMSCICIAHVEGERSDAVHGRCILEQRSTRGGHCVSADRRMWRQRRVQTSHAVPSFADGPRLQARTVSPLRPRSLTRLHRARARARTSPSLLPTPSALLPALVIMGDATVPARTVLRVLARPHSFSRTIRRFRYLARQTMYVT